MKKVYTKPEIYFDSFELSQSIAAGCGGISNYAYSQCSVTVDDNGFTISIFNTGIYGCDYTTPEFTDKVCYDVPSADYKLFTS